MSCSSAGSVVDFLKHVGGVDEDLYSTGVPVDIDGIELRVMNPLLCLESRAYNVIEIASKYDNPHGLKQLRASVLCAREFIREALDGGEKRFALDAINRVFRFCCSRLGVVIYVQKLVDAFQAIEPTHPALPDKFRTIRYPQMAATLARRRGGA